MSKSRATLQRFLLLAVLLAFACRLAFGQAQTGEILGTVMDATSASVPGATVTATNTDTGIARGAKTDDQGRYDISDLNIGNYQVQAEMQGFSTQLQKGLILSVGQKLVTDFKLQVGTVTQEVTVSSVAAPQINTTTSEVGALVGEQQMQDLPLNGRNYNQLLALVPNVAPLATNLGGANFGSSPRFSVAGARPDAGAFLLDGVEIRTFWGAGGGLAILGTSLGVDGIAEFQTLTSSFNAQYDESSVLNEVTRSGTNNFHGSGYGFFRNSALNTRGYFDPTTGPPNAHYNQFGGAVGGPIRKNSTFFFVNYEGLRAILSANATLTIPDANAHAGYLPCSQAKDLACNTVNGAQLANVGVNPAVAPILALFPDPSKFTSAPGYQQFTNGTVQFINYGSTHQSEDFVAGKVDHQFSAKNNIAFRYVRDHGLLSPAWATPGDALMFPNIEHDPETNQYYTVQDRHIFSESLINVATISFVRTNQLATDDLSQVPSALTFIAGRGTGEFSISNVSAVGTSQYLPVHWVQNNFQEGDEVDWIHGAHSLKFGASVTRIQCNCIQITYPGGAYNFGAAASGAPYSGLEAFLEDKATNLQVQVAGLPNETVQQSAQRYSRQTNLGMFVQDDFKVSRRLTLNLGVRYDPTNNPTEANGLLYRISSWYPTLYNPPSALTGFVHQPHYFQNNPSTKNIDPRIGLAWDVFGDHKTSFRAGWGMFHNLIYPREYIPGGSYAFPQVQVIQTNPPFSVSNMKPIPSSTPIIARSQAAWDFPTPYNMGYNATLERQIPGSIKMSLAYVGGSGVHLVNNLDSNTNIPSSSPGPNGLQSRPSPCNTSTGVGCTPDPAFGPVELRTPQGNSHYNSMVISAQRNLGNGIQFQSGFTWSKCIDWGSSGISTVDVPNDSTIWVWPHLPKWYNKGLCSFNSSKNWTSNALIPLPFHGNRLKDGWRISAINTVRTGQPITPSIGGQTTFDRSNFGQYYYLIERPDLNPTFTGPFYEHVVTTSNGVASFVQWYNPGLFQVPAVGNVGNARRNMITAPGLWNSDLSVMKDIAIHESMAVQVRADVFNVFNHTNLGFPSASAYTSTTPNPAAGRVTSIIGNPRQFQFSAKFQF